MNQNPKNPVRWIHVPACAAIVIATLLAGCDTTKRTHKMHDLYLIDQHFRSSFTQLGAPDMGPDWLYAGTEDGEALLSRWELGFSPPAGGEARPLDDPYVSRRPVRFKAARFGGVNPARLVLFSLGTGGALAGMAGLFEVAGPAGQISIDFNSGYGFTAIIVAFLGRLHPIGILLAGLLMALTYIGGELAQTLIGMPAAAIQLFQGMLLFFLLAMDVFANYRVRLIPGEAQA